MLHFQLVNFLKIFVILLIFFSDSDKSIQLDKNWRTFMKIVGDADDAYFYAKYIQKEALTLDKHYLRTITPPKLHQFIKDKIKFMLDHGDYWQCDALIGGIDMVLKKTFLSFIDYRGYSITEKVNFFLKKIHFHFF